ncbi:hypothetical protein M2451_004056 [Dysgonomonas sp. PFB1-18]|nr:hypothetical protein [Dysgonomonas sp. PF1-14]MDH6341026.1 hypothetical protein [Dysgonomonas sp. PF1-16]MDH6382709.1 hypothetical protein [Dysgonomonas sp. PFB1-18]MDH6400028.1 hypothetical protein [Dysgonomonas sp. PF1-23]
MMVIFKINVLTMCQNDITLNTKILNFTDIFDV